MYKLILLLFISSISFAQYANNAVTGTDSTFAGAGNWVAGIGTPTFDVNSTVAGKMYLVIPGGSNKQVKLVGLLTSGVKYKVSAKIRLNSGTAGNILVGQFASNANVQILYAPTGTEVKQTKQITPTADGDLSIGSTTAYAPLAGNYEFDDIGLWTKRDTLWIYSTGSNTDADTCKTLTEAFVARGSHLGGTFIAEPGTYSETITIDSSFTLWKSATAGQAVTVTAVDFAGVTATLLDIYVTTPTNDSNITYTYTPATATTRKRNFDGWGKYGGWLK